MNPSSAHSEASGAGRHGTGWRRWLVPAALVLVMPKCVLCLLAYLGLGAAAATFAEREWCGGSGATPHVMTTGIALVGVVLVLVRAGAGALARARSRP